LRASAELQQAFPPIGFHDQYVCAVQPLQSWRKPCRGTFLDTTIDAQQRTDKSGPRLYIPRFFGRSPFPEGSELRHAPLLTLISRALPITASVESQRADRSRRTNRCRQQIVELIHMGFNCCDLTPVGRGTVGLMSCSELTPMSPAARSVEQRSLKQGNGPRNASRPDLTAIGQLASSVNPTAKLSCACAVAGEQ
jgi:hypothetical protein